jgi:hypothetical protein
MWSVTVPKTIKNTSSIVKCPFKEPILTFSSGKNSTNVKWLQWHLNRLIDKKILSGTKLVVDGDWGIKTSALFKAFQTKYPTTGTKGKPDGKCGKTSRTILKALYNKERWLKE